MNDEYRFLAVDVDGTLLNSRNQLPAANREALHRAHGAGMKVCLCTGRSVAEARSVIDQLSLDSDAGVFVFGAIVSRLPAGDTLHRTTIPEPTTTRLVSYFRSRAYPVLVLYDVVQTGVDYRFVPGERNPEVFEQWLAMAPARVERIDDWHPGSHDPVRVTIIIAPEHISDTMASLQREFPPDEVKVNPIFAPNYGLHVVECFAPDVSKWHGITQLAGPMGIAGSEIVAIGDDINDLEMIRGAGLGIAMGNAIEPIKEAASWQAPTHDACGVAAAIDALLAGDLSYRR